MGHSLVPLISQEEIATAVKRLAHEIDQDYGDRPLVIIGVLKGSFVFLADLIRQIKTPIQRIELIRLSSYGSGTTSSGTVTMQMDIAPELVKGQHVLIVEDIVDTGRSTTRAIAALNELAPASIALCSLLDKPDRRQMPVEIHYLGITIPDRFIVGYGIDFDEQYRQLPNICAIDDH